VTGASGFLGRYIADALLARGARVVGVVRRPERGAALHERGVELRRADLLDRRSLAHSFEGVDAVVANAALLSLLPVGWRETLRTNVTGSENAIRAMAEAGVRRAVQISSVGVYRGHHPPVDEEHPRYDARTRATPWNAYYLSKALAEERAWRLCEELGIALTALRPGGIYGTGDRHFTRVHRLLVERPPVTLYPCLLRVGLVYAGDVADAVAGALARDRSAGRAYNLVGEDPGVWEFARAWRRAGGRSARLRVPVPVPVVRRFATERARRELAWSPRSYEEGVRDLLAREAAEAAAAPLGPRSRAGS
jgi:nucleoside-diphosphate-sugar epimerase